MKAGTILCVDLGNSRASAALFSAGGERILRFDGNPSSREDASAWADFLATGLQGRTPEQCALCSVVPKAMSALIEACADLSGSQPFVLRAEASTLLQVRYGDPSRLGPDRLAAAIAASRLHPGRDFIVMDLGTAFTVDAVSASGAFLGGTILPGPQLQSRAMAIGAALLPEVDPAIPASACGRDTASCIASGIHWGLMGAVKEISSRLSKECFPEGEPLRIATGGWATAWEESLPKGELPWDEFRPDLVLEGALFAALAHEGE